jgi:hypothetical protein
MITKIKNTNTRKITFDTFEIAKDEIQTISWDKAVITPSVFAEMIKNYNNNKLQFLDENDNVLSSAKTVEYYVLDENGQQSLTPETEEVDEVLILLNRRYSEMKRVRV